jgi:hypothetical protein
MNFFEAYMKVLDAYLRGDLRPQGVKEGEAVNVGVVPLKRVEPGLCQVNDGSGVRLGQDAVYDEAIHQGHE